MKMSRLLLQAFGPFTDTALDFASGPANLHLIYGPNEAGKSSALRAMTDLRFGIPTRSPDDFIHPFNQLRIGGSFIDGQGETLGVIRRKGRGNTLARVNMATGQPDPSLAVTREIELALTGGLQRGEFESMFGLNHFRLREGGDLLLKGEGELGSALFEASAGTLGIAAILAELDADAKKLYNPHGAAKTATLNEARRQLDEQRQILRQTQTKPNDWQTLQRVHEAAKSALAELDQALETHRRRENELTELRTVEPLLREHDRVLAELEGYADIPDLPDNAREQRLSAEQELQRIRLDIEDANCELAQCGGKLAVLTIEPALLEHADAIERLAAGIEAAVRCRLEITQQQPVIEKMRGDIADATGRIGLDAEEMRHVLPSAGERASLDHHLLEIGKLGERLDGYRQQAEKVEQAVQLHSEENVQLPATANRQVLSVALRQAQALGDVARKRTDLNRQCQSLESQTVQALSELNVPTMDVLRSITPLLETEVVRVRRAFAENEEFCRKLRDEANIIRRDLDEPRLRKQQLQAEGEILTGETLRLARKQRDGHWRKIRQNFLVESAASVEPAGFLAEVFESAQTEADRQADMLRADAKRVAGFEECSARIAQMENRQGEIANELLDLSASTETLQFNWSQCLAEAGLPTLQPEPLREWQSLRLDALAVHDRLATVREDLELTEAECQLAKFSLTDALKNVGFQPLGMIETTDLPTLIEQALIWEKSCTEAHARHEERIKSLRSLHQDRALVAKRMAETEASLKQHQDRLREWHERLLLKLDSPPQSIKARLEELDAIERQIAQLNDVLLRQTQHQAVIDDIKSQARQLADLLGEPRPDRVEDFSDRLRKRLNLSIEQDQQRKGWERDQARAADNLKHALASLEIQTGLLARLCEAANVESHGQLPEREQAAAQKRHAGDRLFQLRQQLALASSRKEESLRQSLAGLDAAAIDGDRERCKTEIARLEQEQVSARQQEERNRRALEAIDASDCAAKAREAMESAAARWRAALRPWARLRLAHALLAEALNRFRERAQAPMVASASAYFSLMTDGRYARLVAEEQDGKPVLRALRVDGVRIGVEAMSEGTADQLYLALRLAALELRRASHPQMPLILDDALITSDDHRARNILQALARFAEGGQVMLFTHHLHLIELAKGGLDAQAVALHSL
jgi:exonuclease SbcC